MDNAHSRLQGAMKQFAILFENRLPNISFTNESVTQSF